LILSAAPAVAATILFWTALIESKPGKYLDGRQASAAFLSMDDVGDVSDDEIAAAKNKGSAGDPQNGHQKNGHPYLLFIMINGARLISFLGRLPNIVSAKILFGTLGAPFAFLTVRGTVENRAMVLRTYSFAGWSWSAVFVGTIASLIFQVLLVMVGFGLGLLSIDVPSAEAAPTAVSWAVFCWWAVSGVISAFAGGWVAANFSEIFTAESRAAHGLVTWALAD
jgi:hypothetical protein